MAVRSILSKNLLRSFQIHSGSNAMQQPRMLVGTLQKPLENASKSKKLNWKKYYELIPLFVIVGGGISVLMCFVARLAMTRDDVRFLKSGKMDFEKFEMEKDKQPKIKKFLTFNQKYQTPSGLVEAMEAINETKNE